VVLSSTQTCFLGLRFATLGESRRKNLFVLCRTPGRIPQGLRHPFGDRCRKPTPRVRGLAEFLS